MSSKKIRITLDDGTIIDATDDGDADLTPEQEAHYEDVADEIMALPDQLKYSKRGRPALDPGAEGRSPSISFRLPAAARDAADELARSRGFTSAASLARHLLEHELELNHPQTVARRAEKKKARGRKMAERILPRTPGHRPT